jgi:Tfp pilus assembly protein PilX
MKRNSQQGFITMIIMILLIVFAVIGLVFLRVVKANQ